VQLRDRLRAWPRRAPLLTLSAGIAGSVALGLMACARTAEERQLDQMREDIDRIQAARDRDSEEVLHPLVADETPARVAPVRAPPPPPSAGEPAPGVVSVGPGSDDRDDEPPDTEDTSPRPVLRIYGASRGPGRYLFRSADPDAPAAVDDGSAAAPARAGPLDPEAKRAYDAALALVNAHQFDKALDALASFLLKWPDHPYADNAMYWRGECYFARGEYSRAAEQFEGVVARFPVGDKVPDALLKLGICSQKLGNALQAKAWFDRLMQQAPQSDAARRIPAVTAPAATPPGPAPEGHR